MSQWDTVTIVGVGLIGGSIGLALRERGLARQIVGVGRRESSLHEAMKLGAVTSCTTEIAAGVRDAQLVIVCTPVGQIAGHVRDVAAHCPAGTLITDAGSTKAEIVDSLDGRLSADVGVRGTASAAEAVAPSQTRADVDVCGTASAGEAVPLGRLRTDVAFIGSHPLAGSEKTGPTAARGDLFDGRLVIVTPSRNSQERHVAAVEQFWSALGSRTLRMSPEEHDTAIATVSHVPHVVASILAATTPDELQSLVATGWLDCTRVAAGDVELWRQILAANRGHALKSLDNFAKVLSEFRAALARDDQAEIIRLLEAGKQRRDAVGS